MVPFAVGGWLIIYLTAVPHSHQCFVSTLRSGLLQTIGQYSLLQTYYPSFEQFAVRAIFDVTFFIVITTIGECNCCCVLMKLTITALNVVLALIVDSYDAK